MKVVKTKDGTFALQTDQGNTVGVYTDEKQAAQAKAAADYTIAQKADQGVVRPGEYQRTVSPTASPVKDAYQGAYQVGQTMGNGVNEANRQASKLWQKMPTGLQKLGSDNGPELAQDYYNFVKDSTDPNKVDESKTEAQRRLELGTGGAAVRFYNYTQQKAAQNQAVEAGQRVAPTQVSMPVVSRQTKEQKAEELGAEAQKREDSTMSRQTATDWAKAAQAYDKVYHEDPSLHNALAAAHAYERAGQDRQAFDSYLSALKHHGKEMSPETHKILNDKAHGLAGSEVKPVKGPNES